MALVCALSCVFALGAALLSLLLFLDARKWVRQRRRIITVFMYIAAALCAAAAIALAYLASAVLDAMCSIF